MTFVRNFSTMHFKSLFNLYYKKIIFWIFNAMGTLVSGLAIKKGYATELARGRVLTLALLVGTILGYIIGNLVPLWQKF